MMMIRRRCRGRAWPRCRPSIGCARRARVGDRRRWYPSTALEDLLASTKTRSTTRSYRAWIGCCRIKRNWNSISSSVMASYSGPSLMFCCTTSRARMWKGRGKESMMRRGYSRDHRPDCEQMVIALIVNREGFRSAINLDATARCLDDGNHSVHGGT